MLSGCPGERSSTDFTAAYHKDSKACPTNPNPRPVRYTATITLMSKMLLAALAAVSLAGAQSVRLTDIHQLTHGGQNAEAYWSPDGKRLIFQTARPPYGCDQIFIMNADGSDQHLVST